MDDDKAIRGVACSCSRVRLVPGRYTDGTLADAWVCCVEGGCRRRFVPEARVAELDALLRGVQDALDRCCSCPEPMEMLTAALKGGG